MRPDVLERRLFIAECVIIMRPFSHACFCFLKDKNEREYHVTVLFYKGLLA